MSLIGLCRSCFSDTCTCADSNCNEEPYLMHCQDSLSLLSSNADSNFLDSGSDMRIYLRKRRNALIPCESSLRNDDDPKIREAMEYFYGPVNDKRLLNVSNCSSDSSCFSFQVQDFQCQNEAESQLDLGPLFQSSTQNNSHSSSSDNVNASIRW